MSKITQKIFSKYYTEELISKIENGNFSEYLSDSPFPYENKMPPGESTIEVNENFSLKLPLSSAELYDMENSISLYSEFKSITETQASDNRLWTYLSHINLWEYMRKRWPAEKLGEESEDLFDELSVKNRQANFIISRYHLKTPNRRRLLRNGISRLWWYAHLTYDDKRSDPFELTRILLAHQDKAQNLLERSLGSDNKILVAVLEYLKFNPGLTREQVRDKIKEINLVGGVKNLHLLEQNEILEIIN
ncbi:MAG: hypothetical protein B6D44_00325 [Ignavibacteriales bacterium UTCHB2]|nr:hypothetical protein [Ignavibacteriales bacterium]OQY76032.1 MAG: hypothetical protein B6D44_00325 [Ignavibacteriales bacterium UTCHB2]